MGCWLLTEWLSVAESDVAPRGKAESALGQLQTPSSEIVADVRVDDVRGRRGRCQCCSLSAAKLKR